MIVKPNPAAIGAVFSEGAWTEEELRRLEGLRGSPLWAVLSKVLARIQTYSVEVCLSENSSHDLTMLNRGRIGSLVDVVEVVEAEATRRLDALAKRKPKREDGTGEAP